MKMKWALFNHAAILRAPEDGTGSGDAVVTDFAEDESALADALFADDPDDQAADADGQDDATDADEDPDADLSEDEKAAKAAKEAEAARADEDGKTADEDPDGDTEEVYTVKVDGEEFEVTQSELISGYQRQRDYTQKTQAHSAQVQQWEQERQAEVGQLKNALSYYALPTAKEPRPEDFAGKPEEFMQAYGQWQQQSTRQSEAAQLLEAITAEETQRVLAREAGLLREKIPEWADETVRQAEYAKMTAVATDRYGFTPDEISQLTDHRLLPLLRDAMRMAEIDAKPVVMKRKTEVKPKLSAGAKTKTDHKAEAHAKAVAKLNSGKAMSEDDFANMLFQ